MSITQFSGSSPFSNWHEMKFKVPEKLRCSFKKRKLVHLETHSKTEEMVCAFSTCWHSHFLPCPSVHSQQCWYTTLSSPSIVTQYSQSLNLCELVKLCSSCKHGATERMADITSRNSIYVAFRRGSWCKRILKFEGLIQFHGFSLTCAGSWYFFSIDRKVTPLLRKIKHFPVFLSTHKKSRKRYLQFIFMRSATVPCAKWFLFCGSVNFSVLTLICNL